MTSTLTNLKTPQKSDTSCVRCHVKGLIKRWKISFCNNRQRAYLCCFCLQELGGVAAGQEWLEANVIFSRQGHLEGFKREEEVGYCHSSAPSSHQQEGQK